MKWRKVSCGPFHLGVVGQVGCFPLSKGPGDTLPISSFNWTSLHVERCLSVKTISVKRTVDEKAEVV